MAFCEERNPYKRKVKESSERESRNPFLPVEGVVKLLVGTDLQWNEYFYPVMLHMALLIQKTNFATLEDIG